LTNRSADHATRRHTEHGVTSEGAGAMINSTTERRRLRGTTEP